MLAEAEGIGAGAKARDWAYDFRELAKAGLIGIQRETPARGGVERYYGLTDLGEGVLASWRVLESRLSE